MLVPFLLAASLLSAQQASMECSNIGTTQTQAVRGPAGAVAVLKVSTEDDHSKESHECMARYQLIVTPGTGAAAIVADLDWSDGAWGRGLSLQLDGFSRDGKRVFGIFSEREKPADGMLFDYHTTDGNVQIFDIANALQQIIAAKCGRKVAVAGTTETGSIVLESDPTKNCGAKYRWLLDPATSKMQRFSYGQPILGLYQYKVDAR